MRLMANACAVNFNEIIHFLNTLKIKSFLLSFFKYFKLHKVYLSSMINTFIK